jgi:hypothetical protein
MFAACFKKVEDDMDERITAIFETKILPSIKKLIDEKLHIAVLKPEEVQVGTD